MKAYVVFMWEPYESGWPEKYFIDEEAAKQYVLESKAHEENRLIDVGKKYNYSKLWLSTVNRTEYDYEEIEVIE